MLMPVNVLISLILFPFVLIVGYPRKIGLCKSLLMYDVGKKFPVSSRTPIFYIKPWAWYQDWLTKKGIGAQAFACFIVQGENANERTLFHEAIHIIQQSMFTPFVVLLSYLFDLLMYAPFKSWYTENTWRKIPVVEMTARAVTAQDDWRRK